MIPEYMEPKGLAQDAAAFDDVRAQQLARHDAAVGSQRLVDAILRAKGIEPPVRKVVPKPKARTKPRLTRAVAHKPECCPMCGAPKRQPRLLVAHIQAAVVSYFGLHESAMTSARRGHEIAHPRQIAMYLASELTNKSLPDIGRRFGGRDHTTVMWAIKAVTKRIEADPETAIDVAALRAELSA